MTEVCRRCGRLAWTTSGVCLECQVRRETGLIIAGACFLAGAAIFIYLILTVDIHTVL